MLLISSCFNPNYNHPRCSLDRGCPDEMICDSQDICELLPDTCHASHLSCPSGQICAASQSICIDIGGCGDGVVELGEACDDGNVIDGDGCSRDCKSTEQCGNSLVDPGEECDDGNIADGDGCSHDCNAERCGNGVLDPGEECDPGPKDSPGCNSNMAGFASCRTARCGDDYTNKAAGEQCDSGGLDTAKCNGSNAGAVSCHLATCGDGYTNAMAGEQCDNIGGSDTYNCNGAAAGAVSCQISLCGDDYINMAAEEQCDDGFGCSGSDRCFGCACRE